MTFFLKTLSELDTKPKYNISQHGTVFLLIPVSIPTVSTHTPLFFKQINVLAPIYTAFTGVLSS